MGGGVWDFPPGVSPKYNYCGYNSFINVYLTIKKRQQKLFNSIYTRLRLGAAPQTPCCCVPLPGKKSCMNPCMYTHNFIFTESSSVALRAALSVRERNRILSRASEALEIISRKKIYARDTYNRRGDHTHHQLTSSLR